MTRRAILAICMVALGTALMAPLVWGGAAQATEPGHIPVGPERTQVRGLPPVPELPRRPANPLPTSRILLEDAEPIARFDLDRSLTKLCRDGRFRQQRSHLYVVRLGGILYGAVIGGRWGLYDPARLAVPDLIYALRWQDTGRCEVYVVRHLNPV